jgi:hypothetical protein
VASLLSVAVHLLAVLAYPLFLGPPPAGTVSPAGPTRPPRGIEVVHITEVLVDAPRPVAEPAEEIRTPARPDAPVAESIAEERGVVVGPIGPLRSRSRTAAEEIRPREGDPRLWAPDEITAVDGEWLARLRILWALERLNDSTSAAAMAAAAGREWTYTDEDGKKWGISPGKIHLGDITLPLPSFSAPYGSASARRAREDAEILRGAIEQATQETLEERARAIQERMDRERAEARRDTTGRGRGGGG